MKLGIILVHGYTGSNLDFKPLADKLITDFGEDSVNNLSLPGHNSEIIPEFNENSFIKSIHHSIQSYQSEGRKIIIIGHSTGGSLALATILQYSIKPELLVFISVPKKIDTTYFERWDSHRRGKEKISLIDVAMMVKFINLTGSKKVTMDFPTLIIHGENDRLVPANKSHDWNLETFSDSTRVITIPQAGHAVFESENKHLIIDLISRAIKDLLLQAEHNLETINSLIKVEPGLKDFFIAAPFSEGHLSLCPGAQRVTGKKPELLPVVQHDPAIANIEITTYCNLKCQFCARAKLNKPNKHMSSDTFISILGMLPNTYKIVLVGLGETLMHPQILDFIKYGKLHKKKVGLVTNGMVLNKALSMQLLEAGLDSIAFSIDGFDQELSSIVREGTNFSKVITNIKEFTRIANSYPVSKAVFSAVSTSTAPHLIELVEMVSELGVDVLMLSDINFKTNLAHTLWQNIDDQIEGTVKKAISNAFSKSLPVLSVHGLEEFGLENRYHDFLMIPPAQLYQRSKTHTWCYSPWQTIPIDVNGNITLCDCQPELVLGNLFQDSFSSIWNGETLKNYRAEMLGPNPPEICKICPRF